MKSLTHHLKINKRHFEGVVSGNKKAEFRKADRDFKVGDIINLNEFVPFHKGGWFTGRSILVTITDVTEVNLVYPNELRGAPRFVMLSFHMFGETTINE